MKQVEIGFPTVALIAITRGLGGIGIGLLLAEKLSVTQRRWIGISLGGIGIVSTVPLLTNVFKSQTMFAQDEANENQFDWHHRPSIGTNLLNESVKRLF